jgi:hypothetical protein
MRRILIALMWLGMAVSALATTRTASVSGNWNDAAIWGGTMPVSGDRADINGDVVVTIPLGFDAACQIVSVAQTANSAGISTLIINGTLTLDSGQYIKIGGGASRDGKLILGPGSLLVVPTAMNFNNGYLESTATKANPAKITGAGSITTAAITGPRQNVNIANVSFQNAGDVNFVLEDTTGLSAGASTLTITNCTFVGNRTITFGAADTLNSIPISVTNCDFRDMVTTRTITIRRVDGGAATYEFKHNTLFQTVSGSNKISLTPTTSGGLTIDGNVFDNATITEATPGGHTITNNFHTSRIAVTPGFATLHNGSGSTVSYNYLRPSADNSNGLSATGTAGAGTHIISYNVFEGNVDGVTFTDRPDFYVPNATPLATNLIYNLIIGAGELGVGYNVPNWLTLNIKNNTQAVTVSSATDGGGSTYVSENTKSSGTINIANNLIRGNGKAGATAVIGSTSGADQVVGYSDYNNFYNEAVAYQATQLTITAGNTTKAVPGSHDIASDPQFVDETRTLAGWDSANGSGTGTAAAGIAYLLGINGYRGTPNFDQNSTASPKVPRDLLDWVRAGFAPRNTALKSAGDPSDGSPDIGAVPCSLGGSRNGMLMGLPHIQ